MTKAAKILKLYAAGQSTRVIADKLNTSTSYVRTVARQRKGRGQSEHDLRYIYSPQGQARYRARYAKSRGATS